MICCVSRHHLLFSLPSSLLSLFSPLFFNSQLTYLNTHISYYTLLLHCESLASYRTLVHPTIPEDSSPLPLYPITPPSPPPLRHHLSSIIHTDNCSIMAPKVGINGFGRIGRIVSLSYCLFHRVRGSNRPFRSSVTPSTVMTSRSLPSTTVHRHHLRRLHA